MIPADKLYAFTEWEAEQYSLQPTLRNCRLLEAADSLDQYSCHSQPHVLEVMEQCEALMSSFALWLKERLPGVSPAWMRDHLLLSAKLHDIGMCGTPSLRALLTATDELYTLLSAPGREPAELLAPYLNTLEAEAPRARLATQNLQRILRLGRDAADNEAQLMSSLAEYHEEIKSAIRKQHAANSGRFILEHAGEISAHYGPEVDVAAVAVLAALHSSSSLDKCRILPQGDDYQHIRGIILDLVTGSHSGAEAARITAEEPFRRLVYLAALLRLADTRRSGSRLTSMDQTPIVCEVGSGGQVALYRIRNGLREAIPLRASFDILASEALTEFGPVYANPNVDGTWHIRHVVTLHHAELPHIRDIFARSRLKTYAGEIDTAALNYPLGFTHEIHLHLEGLRPMAAARAVKQWRGEVEWLADSQLQITTV